MSTNGESARQWLKKNFKSTSVERIQLIIKAIQRKIEALHSEDPTYNGLLEALDVMEGYDSKDKKNETLSYLGRLDQLLDLNPLISNTAIEVEITPDEKKRRFQEILKESDL